MKSVFLTTFLFLVCVNFYGNTTVIKNDTLQLQNEILSVKIVTKGAEIISLFNKTVNFEHIWQGNKSTWNQHAPILFPIVGKLKNGSYNLDGKNYKMKNHGFASKSNFTVILNSNSEVILELESSPETLKKYPYKFKLLVKYTLKRNKLSVNYSVENTDDKEIFFSIGAHPGFNIPFEKGEKYNDYYLEFNKIETIARLPLTKEKGLLSTHRIEKYLDNTNKFHLNHQLFKDRAIIFEGLKSSTITIKSLHSAMNVTIGIKHFPFLGIWTAAKSDENYICIEPWFGISDVENTTGDFKTKKGIQSLTVGKSFSTTYFIEINNN
jgi:galactose mutarotase-like enzyme